MSLALWILGVRPCACFAQTSSIPSSDISTYVVAKVPNMDKSKWSDSLGVYSGNRLSGGLLFGGLLSHPTDFGARGALIRMDSLGVTLGFDSLDSLGVYSLGVYCLTLPILELATHSLALETI